MKSLLHAILFFIAVILTPGCNALAQAASSFCLYLTAEPVDARILAYGQGDWSHIRLAETPIISASDIISYDFEKHTLKLRPEAFKRIPRPPVGGTPFIVVAGGERIYLGAFTTSFSSIPLAIPSITVDGNPPDLVDTLVMDRTYPPSEGIGPDPRSDPRIKSALTASGLIRPSPPSERK